MLGNFEQQIYNEYLKVSRTAVGKPYKLRKDFTSIDSSTELYIKRISRILTKFRNITPVDFFEAPYAVYGKDEYFDLKFFASQRALKTYTIYMQQEAAVDPDSSTILQRVMISLKKLKEFCINNKLSLAEYMTHTTSNLPTFLLHLKERLLSTYIALELPTAIAQIKQQDASILNFMFGESFHNNLNTYKTKLYASTTCKLLVREGLKKIEKSVVSLN